MDDEYYLLLNEWFLILIISDLWCFLAFDETLYRVYKQRC